MAVAAHAHRRPGQQADPDGRAGHRLRRRFLRARPHVAAASPPTLSAVSTTPRAQSCARCRATMQVLADAIKHSRVVLGESGLPFATPTPKNAPPSAGIATLGADPRPYLLNYPGPAAQRAGAGAGRQRARPVHHPHRARRHRAPRADGDAWRRATIMPSLTLEMLRVATGASTILIRSDAAGMQERGGARLRDPDRPQRPALDPFRAARPGALRLRRRRAGRQGAGRPLRAPAGADRHLGGRACSTPRRRRSIRSCPASRSTRRCWKACSTSRCCRRRTTPSAPNCWRRSCWARSSSGWRRSLSPALLLVFGAVIVALTVGASWYFYIARPAADRFHLSAAVEPAGLSHADVLQLLQRAGAAPPHPLGLRPISVAGAGRAAGAVAREAGARRRRAQHDHPVQRRARLHHHLRALQARPAGPDPADEQLPDAADQRHHRPQGHHRQIHGRRDHGVLERAARRSRARGQRLRGGARHAGARQAAQRASASRRPRPRARASSSSMSASASTPALAWSAIWAPTCASTIRCWATASTSPRGWRARPRPTACRSSSARAPREAVKDKFALLEVDFITVKGKTEPEVIYTILGRREVAATSQFEKLYEASVKMLQSYRSREWDFVMAIIEASRGDGRSFRRQWPIGTILRACSRIPGKSAAGRLEWRFRLADQIGRWARLKWQ